MGLRIYNNVEAQNAHRQLQATNNKLSGTMERLSSGLRINRAADDAAGLAVSEEMRTQIRGMNVASRNALDGVSLVQVADGALGGVNDMLQRVRDLAVQAANGTLTDLQRGNLDQEVQSIIAEMARVASDTEFNGIKILSGSVATAASAVTLQVGANGSQVIAFTIATMTASDLGISGLAVSTSASATAAIASIDAAIRSVNSQRASMGAIQNRLEQTISRLELTSENLQAAESRIRDADMASEMIDFTRNQILQQSGTAMLAQANQAPQSILQLLGLSGAEPGRRPMTTAATTSPSPISVPSQALGAIEVRPDRHHGLRAARRLPRLHAVRAHRAHPRGWLGGRVGVLAPGRRAPVPRLRGHRPVGRLPRLRAGDLRRRRAAARPGSFEDARVFGILTVPRNPSEITVNLRAPVVVNVAQRLAKQVVVLNDEYHTRHPMNELNPSLSPAPSWGPGSPHRVPGRTPLKRSSPPRSPSRSSLVRDRGQALRHPAAQPGQQAPPPVVVEPVRAACSSRSIAGPAPAIAWLRPVRQAIQPTRRSASPSPMLRRQNVTMSSAEASTGRAP